MPTLGQCIAELRARQARLAEAEHNGWGDVIPDERQTVQEFQHALGVLLERNWDRLIAASGDLDLGPLPSGYGLHFSGQEPHEEAGDSPSPGVPAAR